jgi:hypothetical protein
VRWSTIWKCLRTPITTIQLYSEKGSWWKSTVALERYMDQTPIHCKVAEEKSLYLSAMGQAFPCCWTANQLYPWYYPEKKSYMWKLLEELPRGEADLNAKNQSLESIVNGPFFQEVLVNSWGRSSVREGKPKCCAKTCGTEFDPFRAQFQSATSENSSII